MQSWRNIDRRAEPRRLLVLVSGLAACVYVAARGTMLNPEAPLYSGLFYLVEVLGICQAFLFFIVSLQASGRQPPPAPPGYSVDVFVTTLNEPYDVVRRTLVAATRIAYPHQTWLLDDGSRDGMRVLAEELGCRYLARPDRIGAKAGNLNHALQHATGEFIAVFDADHAAQPDFLNRLLGYFDDPLLALVQTPQDYFNSNAFQYPPSRNARLIWHDQSPFHYVDQPARDGWNAATLCGCSAVLRRAHLDAVGGFATETVTEDMHTAVRLQKLGFGTLYHPEPLAFGIAPADYRGYLSQRLRWGEGNMQVCRLEKIPFASALTWRQNIAYFLLAFPYLNGWLRAVIYTAPIVALTTHIVPMTVSLPFFAAVFLPYVLSMTLTFEEVCRGYGHSILCERYALARILIGIGATRGLFRGRIPFRVSSKSLSGRHEWLTLLPYFTLFAGGIGATAWAAGQRLLAAAPILGIPDGVLILFSAFALWHSYAAWRLIRHALHSGRGAGETFDCPVVLPVSFDDGSIVFTREISLAGMVVTGLVPPTSRTATLHLPEGSLRLNVEHGGRAGNGTQLGFRWHSLPERDVLDQSLYARAWTRVVRGQHEVDFTPLERAGLVAAAPGTRPDSSFLWTSLLLSSGAGPGRLAFVRPTGDDAFELILFGAPEAELLVLGAPALLAPGSRLCLTGRSTEPLLGERALECMGAQRFASVLDRRRKDTAGPLSSAQEVVAPQL